MISDTVRIYRVFLQICIFVCVRGTEGQTGCRTLFSPQIEKFNLHDFIGLYPSHWRRLWLLLGWVGTVQETTVACSKLCTCDVTVRSQSAL